jgi:hypothetical protein
MIGPIVSIHGVRVTGRCQVIAGNVGGQGTVLDGNLLQLLSQVGLTDTGSTVYIKQEPALSSAASAKFSWY